LADQGPIGEEAALLDLAEGGGRIEAAQELEVHEGEFGIAWVGARFGGDAREPDDGSVCHAVVNKDAVARAHIPDGLEGLRVAHAVPDGSALPRQVIDGIGFGVGFCQEIPHRAYPHRTITGVYAAALPGPP
jgi:hypothetical protein